MLFISHANPEDNEFTRWLALRLANEGYPVWCDLTKLLGGEDFWEEIEFAIRNRTAKFLFVISRASNHREGPLKELAVATKVKKQISNFIIPLRSDAIPFDEFNIELNRSIAIDFADGWMAGLIQLLQLLQRDGVQRSPNFSPDAVTQWWRSHFGEFEGLEDKTDFYSSNVVASTLPNRIYRHRLDGWLPKKFDVSNFEHPVSGYGNTLTSFATSSDLAKSVAETDYKIINSEELRVADYLAKGVFRQVEPQIAHNIVVRLLRWGFNAFLVSKGLVPYAMSRGKYCFWFPQRFLPDEKIRFTTAHGSKSWRAMIGYKSLRAQDGAIKSQRFWHFAIEGIPIVEQFVGFAIMPHVIFTENGEPYASDRRQHRARRSQCKTWFNNDWFDRIIATLSFLSDEEQTLPVRLAKNTTISISSELGAYASPVSYVRTMADANVADIEDEYETGGGESEDDEDAD
jgi:hypothetical protein